MIKPHRFSLIVVSVITAALILQPLSIEGVHPGYGIRLDFASPLRFVRSVASSVVGVAEDAAGAVVRLVSRRPARAAVDSPSGQASPNAQPQPDAPGEAVSKRSRDASFYRNTKDGSTQGIFSFYRHYQSSPGHWDDVDLSYHSSGSNFVADHHDINFKVSGRSVAAFERASGKGLSWTLPSDPSVSGSQASFTGAGGLSWKAANALTGLELKATVTASRGPQTYTFPYQLLAGAKALTVNASGDLVSDVFSIPRALVLGADGVEYPASVWRLGPGSSEASFDFDDSTLPAGAFPYVIDPQQVYTLASTASDAYLLAAGTTYPPTGAPGLYDTADRVAATREKVSGTYYVRLGFVRWSTNIPVGATLNYAALRLRVTDQGTVNAANKYLTADWYTAWPLDASDYDITARTSASGSPGWLIPATTGTFDFPLTGFATNIALNGWTGLRLHISGNSSTTPTGINRVHSASYDNSDGFTPPQLVVVYNDNAPSTPAIDSPASGTAEPSITPVLKASASDTDGDPIDYDFQIYSDPGLTTLVKDSGWLLRTNTYTLPPALLKDGSTYYWRVMARDPYGKSSVWTSSQTLPIRLTKLGASSNWPMFSHGPAQVNEVNGNLVASAPGPVYSTAAGSLSASFSYNSLDTADHGFGPGWVMDAGDSLSNPPEKLIDHSIPGASGGKFDAAEVVFPGGASSYYTHVGTSNVYQPEPGDTSELKRNPDATDPSHKWSWTLTDEDGEIYTFGQTGSVAPLTSEARVTGAEISDASAGQGKLTTAFASDPTKVASITDTAGRALTFTWNALNASGCPSAIVCITGPDGVMWKYVGDGSGGVAGKLARVNDGTRDLVAYGYSASPFKINKIQNANDLDPTHASPGYNATHALTIAYDASNRVSTITDGPTTGQAISTNSIWTLSYTFSPPTTYATAATRAAHADGAIGTIRQADGYTTLKAPNQQGTSTVSTVYYDNLGRTLESIDRLGNISLAGYTSNDHVLWQEVFTENGGVSPTDNTFDPVDNVLTQTQGPDPDGAGPLGRVTTTYRYDEATIGTANTAGTPLTGLQATYFYNSTSFTRDANTIRQTDANVDFQWGTNSPLPQWQTAPVSYSVRWTGDINAAAEGDYTFYTKADDGTRLTVTGDTASSGVANEVVAIDDWSVHNLQTNTSPAIHLKAGWHKISLDYYNNGGTGEVHLLWSCAPGSSGSCSMPQSVIPSTSLRPAWLNQTSTVDPAGRVLFHHYASPDAGHPDYDLVQVGSQNLITSYSYDSLGRMTEKVMPRGNAGRSIDSAGNLTGSPDSTFATDWIYYAMGDTPTIPAPCAGAGTAAPAQAGLQKQILRHGLAAETSIYDGAGRMITNTKGAGTTCNNYSAEGLLTSDQAPGEAAATTYVYDPAGAQRTALDSSGTVTSEYDEQGRLKRSVDSYGAESTFVYDPDGNMTQRNAAVGALGSNPNYVTSYVYDAEDELTQLTDPAARVWTFFYDMRGNLHATKYPNTTFSWQDYNAAGWLTGLYNRHGLISAPLPATVPVDPLPLSDYTYTYFADGKKSQETRAGAAFTTQTTQYTYDTAGRLATANIPDANNVHTLRTYSFDLDSNRTSLVDGSTTNGSGIYDQTNPASPGVDELTSYTDHGVLKLYGYNSDGEVTSRGTDSLTWDGRERMTGGSFSGTSLTYGFDATGRTRSRTSGSSVTRFLYGGADGSLFDTTNSGAIQNTAVAAPAGDLAQYNGAPTIGTTVAFDYYTGHGDLAATADPAGVRQAAYSYDPFGAPLQTPPSDSYLERWTGRWDKRLDTMDSLIQMGARPYDPSIGRFLSVDPVEGGSANIYDYANQEPINGYDLDGTFYDSDAGVRRCDSACRADRRRAARRIARWTEQYNERIARLIRLRNHRHRWWQIHWGAGLAALGRAVSAIGALANRIGASIRNCVQALPIGAAIGALAGGAGSLIGGAIACIGAIDFSQFLVRLDPQYPY